MVEETDEDSEHSDSETSTVQREERDFLTNPYWIDDQDLKKGEVDFLSSSEIQFWKDLIDKYLYPIDQDKEEQVFLCCCNFAVLLQFCHFERGKQKSSLQVNIHCSK